MGGASISFWLDFGAAGALNVHKREAPKFQITTIGIAHNEASKIVSGAGLTAWTTLPVNSTKNPFVIKRLRPRPITLVTKNLEYCVRADELFCPANVQRRFQKKPLETPKQNEMDCTIHHATLGKIPIKIHWIPLSITVLEAPTMQNLINCRMKYQGLANSTTKGVWLPA